MSTEYNFNIDVYSPDTLPMKRLAQYIQQLADLYGNYDQVHFVRVDPGSAVLVSAVENTAVSKVRERIEGAKNQTGSPEALRAWDNINDLLRKDNAKASLREANGAEILVFPGREMPQPDFKGTISQVETLEGRIVGIIGMDNTKHVHVEYGDSKFSCECTEEMARQLKTFLYEDEIRLHGQARYIRNEEGKWELKYFKIISFEKVDNASLSQVVNKLRAINGNDWKKTEDPWGKLMQLRHGNDEARA